MKTGSNRGSTILEGALVLLVIAALIMGAADAGQLIYAQQELTERANAGARWASMNSFNSDAIRNVVVFGEVEPPKGARATVHHLDTGMVNAQLFDDPTAGMRVHVEIRGYPFESFSPWPRAEPRTVTASAPYEAPVR